MTSRPGPRVWFNRWFASAYNVIRMLRSDEMLRPLVFVSHDDPQSLVLRAADHASLEPECTGREYVDFALEFCERNRIDVLWPRREMRALADAHEEFAGIGTRLLVCAPGPLLDVLDDKAMTYERVGNDTRIPLPRHRTATTISELVAGCEWLTSGGGRACVKPSVGTGGAGFWVIDDGDSGSAAVYRRPTDRVPLEWLTARLAAREPFPQLLLTEFLEGPEYSVDCLSQDGDLIVAVPRRRISGRVQALERNEEVIEVARAMCERFRVSYVTNVQVRYGRGMPRLIEMNPRMAAGVNVSLLSGVNIPALALRAAIGAPMVAPAPAFGTLVGRMDEAVALF